MLVLRGNVLGIFGVEVKIGALHAIGDIERKTESGLI